MATWNGLTLVTVPPLTTVYGDSSPRSVEWEDYDVVSANTNPFSLAQQIYSWGQARMSFSFSYSPMQLAQFRAWQVFLRLLQGINGVFLSVADPLNVNPQNGSATAPTVNGVNASGAYTLNVSGGSGQSIGDWISIPGSGAFSTGSRLYQITSVGGGVLGVWPPIREATVGSEAITIRNAQGVWRMKNTTRKYSVDVARHYGLSFEAEEAL